MIPSHASRLVRNGHHLTIAGWTFRPQDTALGKLVAKGVAACEVTQALQTIPVFPEIVEVIATLGRANGRHSSLHLTHMTSTHSPSHISHCRRGHANRV